jgi:acyl-CoA synthetase (AMP-forming)/AMP-acid ligase II
MSTAEPEFADVRHEILFGRVVRCFSQRPRSLWELFSQSMKRDPAADALLWGADGRMTYGELAQRAESVASGLRIIGIGKGERVAALTTNRFEYVVLALAVWRLGAVLVPLDSRLRTPEIRQILAHSGARVLLCEGDLLDSVPARDTLPELERVLVLDRAPTGAGQSDFRELLALTPQAAPAAPDEQDDAAIIYTSGTSGEPKGVQLAHVNIVHSTMHFERVWQLPPGSRSALAIPGSNVTGLVTIILTMLRIGGCIVLLPPFKARNFLAAVSRRAINHTFMVPAQYKLCLMDPDFDSYDLSSWKLGSTGGAPMPRAFIDELQRRIPTLQISDGYGATELASPAIIRPAAMTAEHADSVGLPVACAEVLVMSEDGTEVRPGEAGELWIKGPMVSKGYWRNPEATRANFVHGYWKSGDIATMDVHGMVRLRDRKKDVVNRGGYKIYSVEVESVLLQHPTVTEAAIIARPDPVLGERVHAVVFGVRAAVDEAELRSFCSERLADYKVPETFTILDRPLPRNSNGKIVKRALRESLFTSP